MSICFKTGAALLELKALTALNNDEKEYISFAA